MKLTLILSALLATSVISFGADKPKADPEAVFKKKDANGDGKLSKEEFTKDAKDADKAAKQFDAKDKDKDGFLSLEEFKAAGGKKPK